MKNTSRSPLDEAADKAAFLRWLHTETFGEQMTAADRDAEINRICQRWIRFKIREAAITSGCHCADGATCDWCRAAAERWATGASA